MEDLVEQQQKLDKVLKQDTTNVVIEVKSKPSIFSRMLSSLKKYLSSKEEPMGLKGFMSQGFKIL